MVVDNENLNELDELLKFSLWVAMDTSSSKKDGLEMAKKNFSDLHIRGYFSFENNPLPQILTNIDLINPEAGIRLLLESLRDYVDFINKIIRNIEKYFSGSSQEWRIHYSETELMEFYDVAVVLEREIKAQFVKCVDDFIKNPEYNYNYSDFKLPEWLN